MAPNAPPPPYLPPGHEHMSLSWRHPKALLNLSVMNFLLRVCTLGIYHFWAKTEVRKRLWSGIRINDEPLTYTGRGLELFLGFVIIFALVMLPASLSIFGLMFAFGPDSPAVNGGIFLLYAGGFYLFGVAIYRATRYRLARTRWRGIRGSLEGSPWAYAWTYFWTALLIPLTLGWITPWRTTKLQRLITNNMRFGDRPLRFTAEAGPLYGAFAILWIGTIILYFAVFGSLFWMIGVKFMAAKDAGIMPAPSGADIATIIVTLFIAGLLFALISAQYQARITNHFASHTHFENATFRGNLTAGGLIWLALSNFAILMVGSAAVIAVLAAVVLPFIGLNFNDVAAMQTNAARQVVMGLAPLVILMSFSIFVPIVQARTMRYTVEHMGIDGTAPLAEIAQSSGADVRFGEGLAEAFDVDAI